MAFDDFVKEGSTSIIYDVMLRDQYTGNGKVGVAYGTPIVYYTRQNADAVAVTLAAGSLGDAYSSGKWAEIESSYCKGHYRIHLPNNMFATGANFVTLTIQSAGCLDSKVRFLVGKLDRLDAIRAGLTALPNANAGANGGLPLGDANGYVPSVVKSQDNIDFGALQKTSLNAATPAGVVGAVGSVAAAGIDAILARSLGTEAYAVDGAVPTLAQALFAILSFLMEKEVTGTTVEAKKLDGSTTSMTFTLDSAEAPTTITRTA